MCKQEEVVQQQQEDKCCKRKRDRLVNQIVAFQVEQADQPTLIEYYSSGLRAQYQVMGADDLMTIGRESGLDMEEFSLCIDYSPESLG